MNDQLLLESKERKRLRRTLLLSVAAWVFLYSFVLAPLYTYTLSNVLFDATPVPNIIHLFLNVLDVLSYSVCFSLIIYSIFKYSLRRTWGLLGIYCASILAKYLANFLITSLVDRIFDFSDIFYVLLYFVFDLIMLSLVCIFSCIFIGRFNERKKMIEKSSRALGQPIPDLLLEQFSGKKIFVRENPLHRCALSTAVILSLTKLISRLLSDLYVGAPTSIADLCWMIAYYLSDILIAVIAYAVALFVFNHLNSKNLKDKKELL